LRVGQAGQVDIDLLVLPQILEALLGRPLTLVALAAHPFRQPQHIAGLGLVLIDQVLGRGFVEVVALDFLGQRGELVRVSR